MLSDHGDYTGDYGLVEKTQNTFEDCLTRVPLIVKPPSIADCKPGIRDSLVELIDFYATVEDYCGFTPRHTHFGWSLRSVIAGGQDRHREAVFCEGGRMQGETQCMELESNPTLDPRAEYYPRMKLQRSEEGEHTKATMCSTADYKYVRRYYEQEELYDLSRDPGEKRNIIDGLEYRDILLNLKEKMLTHYQGTCDVVPMDTDERFGPDDIARAQKIMEQQA